MRRTRIAGLCLAVVFTMSAALASGALAASPEFRTCIKATEKIAGSKPAEYLDGEYSDSACSTALSNGKYKLAAYNEGKNKFALKGSSGAGAEFFYIPSSQTIVDTRECTKEKLTGTVTGPKTAEFVLEQTGCKDGSWSCQNEGEGSTKGVIRTTQLLATLVAQPGSGEGVGVLVTNAAIPGGILAEYGCETGAQTLRGGMIGEITGATSEATKTTTYTFAKGPGAFQKFGYLGQDEGENYSSFKKYWEGGPAPDALLINTQYGEGSSISLPTTLQNSWKVTTEAFKIV